MCIQGSRGWRYDYLGTLKTSSSNNKSNHLSVSLHFHRKANIKNFNFTTQQTAQIGTIRFTLDASAEHQLTILQREHTFSTEPSYWHFPLSQRTQLKQTDSWTTNAKVNFAIRTAARKKICGKKTVWKNRRQIGVGTRPKLIEPFYLTIYVNNFRNATKSCRPRIIIHEQTDVYAYNAFTKGPRPRPCCSCAVEIFNFRLIRWYSNAGNTIYCSRLRSIIFRKLT